MYHSELFNTYQLTIDFENFLLHLVRENKMFRKKTFLIMIFRKIKY